MTNGNSQVVAEVTVINDRRVQRRSVLLHNVVCLIRDHTRWLTILRVDYKPLVTQPTEHRIDPLYSYRSLITAEKFFFVSLCRLDMAIRAARMA